MSSFMYHVSTDFLKQFLYLYTLYEVYMCGQVWEAITIATSTECDWLAVVFLCMLGWKVERGSGMRAQPSAWCNGGVTLPQHELVACNGSGAGAGENLTHVLHQAQAVLNVQPEAVWQLPLLDTGRALSYSFQYTGCETFLAEPKTLMNVSEKLG